jgi:hypothetical protein
VVEVDDGWRPDRDFSVAVGRWGWLHVQGLVEEHAQGKCLMRVRSRLRLSFLGTLQGLTTAMVIIGATLALMSVHRPSGSVLGVLAIAMLFARTAWQMTRSVAVFDRALAQVVKASGMMTLPQNRPGSVAVSVTSAAPDAHEGIHAARGA